MLYMLMKGGYIGDNKRRRGKEVGGEGEFACEEWERRKE